MLTPTIRFGGGLIGIAATLIVACSPACADEFPPPAQLATDPVSVPGALFDRAADRARSLTGEALNLIGVRYKYGGNSPESGLDCSGLVRLAVRNALGLELPRTARDIAAAGKQIPLSDLKPGDLVFFNTMRRTFSHVGIYLGDNQFVHAPSSGGQVRVENFNTPYWVKRFEGARRVGNEPRVETTGPTASLTRPAAD